MKGKIMAKRVPKGFSATVELDPVEGQYGSIEKYHKVMNAWQLELDHMKPNKPKFNAVKKISVPEEEE